MKRKLLLSALSLVVAVGAFLLLRLSSSALLQNEKDAEIPPSLEEPGKARSPSPPPVSSPASSKGRSLDEMAQEQVRICLGTPAVSVEELGKAVRALGGENSQEHLDWKVLHLRDSQGNRYRLTVDQERSESGKQTQLFKLFSVDEEGLPDPLPLSTEHEANPSEDGLKEIVGGREVTSQVESRVGRGTSGQSWRIETEDQRITALEFQDKGRHLQCQETDSSFACHCGLTGPVNY